MPVSPQPFMLKVSHATCFCQILRKLATLDHPPRSLGLGGTWHATGRVKRTCNDLSKLPPEFSRAERWDAIYFIDVPNKEQREALLEIYSQKYKVTVPPAFIDSTEGWTGAEVSACLKQAAMLEVPVEEAAKRIVPVSVRMGDGPDGDLTKLREWAAKGATDATTGLPYVAPKPARKKASPKKTGGRAIRRSE